jgi:hypothetical protein
LQGQDFATAARPETNLVGIQRRDVKAATEKMLSSITLDCGR